MSEDPANVYGRETLAGVPLGLSRDYDYLPRAETLRSRQCTTCYLMYWDAERLAADGVKVLTVMCKDCREKGRDRWIAENCVPLPVAVARYR